MDDQVKATWWQTHRPTARRMIQLYSALLHNAHVKGFIDGEIYQGKAKYACVPGLNCYSCPAAAAACPLGALQNALAASGHRAGWYALGILLLFGVTLGRTVCGWLCPMGLIQELLHRIPTPKFKKSPLTRALSWLKYVALAVFALAIPLWYGLKHDLPLPAFCKYICPAGTLEGAVGLLSGPGGEGLFPMLGLLFTRKFVILLAVGLACVFCHRAFCRFLCPLGAIYGLFNGVSLIGVRVDAARCNGCGACARRCGMDVRQVGDRECVSCGECVDACPQGAISLRCGRIVLWGPETDGASAETSRRRRRALLAWSLALAVLALALFCFNRPDAPAGNAIGPAGGSESLQSDAPVGCAPGQRLEDFSCELVGGGEFHLADHRGSVVFINLWATYCAPCVQEMAHFDRLLAERPEVEVLAVHSSLTTEDVAAYLADREWRADFAVDDADDSVFRAVGGSTLLPQTIVLNRRGEVVYNETGSVTYEKLIALLEEAER